MKMADKLAASANSQLAAMIAAGGGSPTMMTSLLNNGGDSSSVLSGGINDEMFALLNALNSENDKMLQAEQIKSEYASKLSEQLRISKLLIGCFLLVIGTIGNSLTFAVFRRRALRSYATSFLLSVLALSNIVVLIVGLLPKMVEYEMKADLLRTSIPYACQIQVFLLYTFLHFTAWVLVLVTSERFVTVWLPSKSAKICTVKNAKLAVSVLLVVQLMYSSQLLVTMGTQELERRGGPLPSNYASLSNDNNDTHAAPELICDAKPQFSSFHDHIFPIFHFAVFCFVPFLVMIVLNSLIAGRLLLLGNQIVLARTPTEPSSSRLSTSGTVEGRLLSGTTMTMFACSLSFFAFTLPVSIYFIVRRQMKEQEVRSNMAFFVMWTVLNLLQYVNNAAGLFYCLFGTLFRRELGRMLVSVADTVRDWLPAAKQSRHDSKQFDDKNGGILLINGDNNNRLSTAVYVGRTNAGENRQLLAETNFHHNGCQWNTISNGTAKTSNDSTKLTSAKDATSSKDCHFFVSESEISATDNHLTCSISPAINAENKRLLEQFGPLC